MAQGFDWLIAMDGGKVIAQGTPLQVPGRPIRICYRGSWRSTIRSLLGWNGASGSIPAAVRSAVRLNVVT